MIDRFDFYHSSDDLDLFVDWTSSCSVASLVPEEPELARCPNQKRQRSRKTRFVGSFVIRGEQNEFKQHRKSHPVTQEH